MRHPQPFSTRPASEYEQSLGGLLFFPIAAVLLVVFLSEPLLAATVVVGGVLAIAVARQLVRTYVNQIAETTRTITLPGIGTVKYRVSPR